MHRAFNFSFRCLIFLVFFLFDILLPIFCHLVIWRSIFCDFHILSFDPFVFSMLCLFDILPLRYFVLSIFSFDNLSVDILCCRYFAIRYYAYSIFCDSMFCTFHTLLLDILQYRYFATSIFCLSINCDRYFAIRYLAFRYFAMEAGGAPL